MNRISISDLHLCRGKADNFRFDRELSRFLSDSLRHFDPLEVVLNGDIFDLIVIENEGDLQKNFEGIKAAHPSVFEAFRSIARQAHLVLVPGNHDHQLRGSDAAGLAKALIPGVEVATGGVYNVCDKDGGTVAAYHFEHGDAHDPWSSLISPQNGERAKTDAIVKDLIQEFLSKPLKIVTSTPTGAAVEALDRVLAKLNLEPHELRLFDEKVKPLMRKFRINLGAIWSFVSNLSVNRIKEFGKIYVAMVGAEIAHGEDPFYRASAERIGLGMTGAEKRVVSFGHTHKPEVVAFDRGILYANSGTWGHDIKKFAPDRFHEITRGTYLLFTKETLEAGEEGVLNYFIPPIRRILL